MSEERFKGAIVYSLFGYDRERAENCFDFNSYLRGLMINIRMNKLLFPDWDIVLETDIATNTAFAPLFESLPIIVEVNPDGTPLTKAMLWRLKPIFHYEHPNWKYTHIICRDLDSPPTYREAQAVKHWINKDTAAHAITDSVSHNLPLLGGMIGFKCGDFIGMTQKRDWDSLFSGVDIDFSRKGADQDYLNKYLYPTFATFDRSSITQHYPLGMANTFLPGYNNNIPDLELGLSYDLKESNNVCGHIGSAGYYEAAMFKFLRKYWHDFDYLLEVEKNYPNIFYWCNE